MKNTQTGKLLTQILSVLLCAVILIMFACCFHPYYSITEPYNKFLNPEPKTDYYSLIDVMWCNTNYEEGEKINVTTNFSVSLIANSFKDKYANFVFNDYVTNMVINFLFALCTVATSIWFAVNEYRKFPSTVAAIFTHICGILCGVFGMMGYIGNDMLAEGIPAFRYVVTIIAILMVVATVLAVARFVIWLLTTIQLNKERKARLALL